MINNLILVRKHILFSNIAKKAETVAGKKKIMANCKKDKACLEIG